MQTEKVISGYANPPFLNTKGTIFHFPSNSIWWKEEEEESLDFHKPQKKKKKSHRQITKRKEGKSQEKKKKEGKKSNFQATRTYRLQDRCCRTHHCGRGRRRGSNSTGRGATARRRRFAAGRQQPIRRQRHRIVSLALLHSCICVDRVRCWDWEEDLLRLRSLCPIQMSFRSLLDSPFSVFERWKSEERRRMSL